VSGVSLDEEMSNLLRFQHGYSAAARALSAMDEMLDTLMHTGRVGA
jgi:flagellar hook-associated protein 1 FlgK